MKHLQPTRYDLYEKAINYKPKTKHVMITVEQCLLFAEWLGVRYVKTKYGWAVKGDFSLPRKFYTTRELWDQYQQFLGKKPKPNP
jgi:hypothetical protein